MKKARIRKLKIFAGVLGILICTFSTVMCMFMADYISKLEEKLAVYEAAAQNEEKDIACESAKNYNEALYNETLDNEPLYDEVMASEEMQFMDSEAAKNIEIDTAANSDKLMLSKEVQNAAKNIENASNAAITQATENEDDVEEIPYTNGKKVYLTFDDGPSKYTNKILDILDENDVKATFFVVARGEDYYDEYNRIVDEGHTLAMHSYSHDYDKLYADLDSFEYDVDTLHDLLYDVTGVDCRYYRFPGGSSNTVSKVDIQDCISYINEKGYIYLDWNSMNGDAVTTELTAAELNENVMKYVRSNSGDSVVLMHDMAARYQTVEALDSLIKTLKEEGYTILPVDENTPLVQHVKAEIETEE